MTIFKFYLQLILLNLINYKLSTSQFTPQQINHRPIIGIIAQEEEHEYGPSQHSFVSAAPVKFLQGGGARVVPVWVNKSPKYYKWIMKRINGLFWPGSNALYYSDHGYGQAARTLFPIANEMNENGDYFPIWGVCYGFQLFMRLGANTNNSITNPLTGCNAKSIALNVDFKPDFKQSRFFSEAPQEVIDILKNQKVAPHFHIYCMTESNLTHLGLDKDYRVISVNKDPNGLEFISTIEHKRYPYYGVAYHMEGLYEWFDIPSLQQTYDFVKVAQFYERFFVNEARKNLHEFENTEIEKKMLINNYPVEFTFRSADPRMFEKYQFTVTQENEQIQNINFDE